MGLTSIYYYDYEFKDCNNVRSYITGKNKKNQRVEDNDYGDFIIADFNFDNIEDIAIENDNSNSGPQYNFYVQDNFKKFHLDRFLTDSMGYFPAKINEKNKTLVTYIIGGACWLGEHIYKLNEKSYKWKQISHKTINLCKNEK